MSEKKRELIYYLRTFEEQFKKLAKDKTVENEVERSEELRALVEKIKELREEIACLEKKEKEEGERNE